MQKNLLLAVLFTVLAMPAFAQLYFTRDAKVKFTSDTPLEKIEGVNKGGAIALDTKTGKVEVKVLIKSFLFEKALLQEHFNENYMESDKFPNATFKGTITNLNEINFTQDGKYTAKVSGKMNMHGVEKDLNTTATVKVSGGNIEVLSNFNVIPQDYNISIPSVVKDKIAKEIKVVVSGVLAPRK